MKVTQRVVKLDESGGEFPGDVLVITEGVEAGERIVVAGTDKLSEGMVVRLYTAGMLSE